MVPIQTGGAYYEEEAKINFEDWLKIKDLYHSSWIKYQSASGEWITEREGKQKEPDSEWDK
jgi:hypothetical protein